MRQDKPARKKTSFLYPEDLLDRLRQLAAQHQRSLNGELVWALEQYGLLGPPIHFTTLSPNNKGQRNEQAHEDHREK